MMITLKLTAHSRWWRARFAHGRFQPGLRSRDRRLPVVGGLAIM
jgi:hypothetical protein